MHAQDEGVVASVAAEVGVGVDALSFTIESHHFSSFAEVIGYYAREVAVNPVFVPKEWTP